MSLHLLLLTISTAQLVPLYQRSRKSRLPFVTYLQFELNEASDHEGEPCHNSAGDNPLERGPQKLEFG